MHAARENRIGSDTGSDTGPWDKPVASFAPPTLTSSRIEQIADRPAVTPLSGPIADLSLNG